MKQGAKIRRQLSLPGPDTSHRDWEQPALRVPRDKRPLFPGLLSEPQLGGLRLGSGQLDLGRTTEQDPALSRPPHTLRLPGSDVALPPQSCARRPTPRKEVEGPSLLMPGYGFQMSPSPYISGPN